MLSVESPCWSAVRFPPELKLLVDTDLGSDFMFLKHCDILSRANPGSVFWCNFAVEWENDGPVTHTHFLSSQDLEMMTSWVGGVEEAVALVKEGGAEAEAEAWDASEKDLRAEARRQTSENPLTVSHLFIRKSFLYMCFKVNVKLI